MRVQRVPCKNVRAYTRRRYTPSQVPLHGGKVFLKDERHTSFVNPSPQRQNNHCYWSLASLATLMSWFCQRACSTIRRRKVVVVVFRGLSTEVVRTISIRDLWGIAGQLRRLVEVAATSNGTHCNRIILQEGRGRRVFCGFGGDTVCHVNLSARWERSVNCRSSMTHRENGTRFSRFSRLIGRQSRRAT